MKTKEEILKEFETYYCLSSIMDVESQNEIKKFLIKALDQTREETIREAIRKIEKIRIAVAKQTGAFKYDSCYEDCIDILNKLKK